MCKKLEQNVVDFVVDYVVDFFVDIIVDFVVDFVVEFYNIYSRTLPAKNQGTIPHCHTPSYITVHMADLLYTILATKGRSSSRQQEIRYNNSSQQQKK
jgi:hypothetical protein